MKKYWLLQFLIFAWLLFGFWDCVAGQPIKYVLQDFFVAGVGLCMLVAFRDRDRAVELLEAAHSGKWLIWSVEHAAWWKPDENDYTACKAEAGRYSFMDALAIVRRGNHFASPDEPHEAMVKEDEE